MVVCVPQPEPVLEGRARRDLAERHARGRRGRAARDRGGTPRRHRRPRPAASARRTAAVCGVSQTARPERRSGRGRAGRRRRGLQGPRPAARCVRRPGGCAEAWSSRCSDGSTRHSHGPASAPKDQRRDHGERDHRAAVGAQPRPGVAASRTGDAVPRRSAPRCGERQEIPGQRDVAAHRARRRRGVRRISAACATRMRGSTSP